MQCPFPEPAAPFRRWRLALACIGLTLVAACDVSSLLSPGDQMFAAAHEGDTRKIKDLLASGKIKNIDETFAGSEMTALQRAVQKRHYDAITLLIAAGANVNHVTTDMTTAIHIAAYQGDRKAAEMLIAAGADVNASERANRFRPLHLALWKGHPDVAKVLVEAGADPFLKTDDGRDAFFIAKRGGHHEFLEWLSRRHK